MDIYTASGPQFPTFVNEAPQERPSSIFSFPKWDKLRQDLLLSQTKDKRGNLSFYLGGNTCQHPVECVPKMEAVHATIRFALRSTSLEDNRDIMYPP